MNRITSARCLAASLVLAAVLVPRPAAGQSVYQAVDHALGACAAMVVGGGTKDALVTELRAAGYVIAGGEFRRTADWGFLMVTSVNTAGCFIDLPVMDPARGLGLTRIFVAGLGDGWQPGVVDDPREVDGLTYRVTSWIGSKAEITFIRDPDGRTHVSFKRT